MIWFIGPRFLVGEFKFLVSLIRIAVKFIHGFVYRTNTFIGKPTFSWRLEIEMIGICIEDAVEKQMEVDRTVFKFIHDFVYRLIYFNWVWIFQFHGAVGK